MKKLFLLLMLTCAAAAQTIAVRAGHLIDPADGSVSNNQVILIENGKIAAIGANVKVPAGAQTIDLPNEWVMPGLVDAHTHITMNLPPAAAGESYWENYLLRESTAFRAERGLHNAELLLNAGFTALRDVGNNGDYADTAVRQAIERDGSTVRRSSIAARSSGHSGGNRTTMRRSRARSGNTSTSTPILPTKFARPCARTFITARR